MNKQTAKLLEQHFDTAFAAPDGIAKLRELILTLAMQGKLVEQNPNDPPASELLKEIETEKQRLVKKGKIKKPKLLSPIKPEEVPYELPQGWEWVRLGALGNVMGGGTPSKSNPTFWEGSIPWVSPKDMKVDYILDSQDHVSEEAIRNSAVKFIPDNSLLIVVRGMILAHSFPTALTKVDVTVNQDMKALIPYVQSIQGYLLTFTKGMKNRFLDLVERSTHGTCRLDSEKLFSSLVGLPPLPEQHRIVARIDQLMARCDELEKLRGEREEKRLAVHAAAIRHLLDPSLRVFAPSREPFAFLAQHFGELYTVKENVTELRKAILQLAVMGCLVAQDPNDPPASELLKEIEAEKQRLVKAGKIKQPKPLPPIKPEEVPYELPQGWEWVRLGDILCFGPTNGFSPMAVDYETPVRSLTLSATTSGVFKGEYFKFIANEIPEDSTLWLEDGDILVQRGNTIEYVGVPAVYRGGAKQFIYPDLMMKLRVFPKICVNYTHRAMSAESSRQYLRSNASGTSSTMPKISQATLRNLPFPLPPSSNNAASSPRSTS